MAAPSWLLRAADVVRKVQRNLPYPVLDRWRDLPPIPSPAAEGRTRLAVLFQPRHFREALWSAWSWMRRLDGPCAPFALSFGLDGEADPRIAAAVARLFPGAEIVPAASFASALDGLGPACAAFVREAPFGRKLAFLYHQQARGPVLYSDSDIVVFRRPDTLLRLIAEGREMAYLTDDSGLFSPDMRDAAARQGIAPVPRLNAGLLYLRQGVVEPAFLRGLIEGLAGRHGHWLTEQDFWAVLAAVRDAAALPKEAYSTDFGAQYFWQREIGYASLAARHYAGPVRHHLYLRGLPYLRRLLREEGAA